MARKRRGRGEGSIHQRRSDLWEAKVSLGCDGKGRRRRITVYGTTKQEVQEKLRQLQTGADTGQLPEAGQLTVGQYLDRWLTIVKPTVEPNTYAPYERHVRLHLKPHIGGAKLAKLSPLHVEQLYARLADAKVSAALARKVGTTLTIALGEAVRLRLILANPATAIRKPKAAKPEIEVLDPDQVAMFLQAAHADRLYAFYVAALDTGMRPGELFALAWQDLDLGAGVVRVTKSLEEISGVLRIKDVKTKKGRRRIDLSPPTVAALAEHRKAMLAAGFIQGPVFCDTQGGHLRISNLHRDSFQPILKRANAKIEEDAKKLGTVPVLLPAIHPYSLRHTSATMLLLADVPAKVVSERLGHASIQLTLDTYSHVLPTMQQRAASVMGALLGRQNRPTGTDPG